MKCIYVDGGTRKSQICMYDPQKEKVIVKTRGKKPSNNELEYLALLYGLQYVKNNYSKENIIIYSDSMLIVNQINGKWRITVDVLEKLHKKCINLTSKNIQVVWINREINRAGWVLEDEKGK